MFGKGVYFADDSAKADQYVGKPDMEWKETDPLHEQLYGSEDAYPDKGVHYMLICRVSLGCSVPTTNGSTCVHSDIVKNGQRQDGQPGGIFLNRNLTELAEIVDGGHNVRFHSIVADLGDKIG